MSNTKQIYTQEQLHEAIARIGLPGWEEVLKRAKRASLAPVLVRPFAVAALYWLAMMLVVPTHERDVAGLIAAAVWIAGVAILFFDRWISQCTPEAAKAKLDKAAVYLLVLGVVGGLAASIFDGRNVGEMLQAALVAGVAGVLLPKVAFYGSAIISLLARVVIHLLSLPIATPILMAVAAANNRALRRQHPQWEVSFGLSGVDHVGGIEQMHRQPQQKQAASAATGQADWAAMARAASQSGEAAVKGDTLGLEIASTHRGSAQGKQ